MTIRKRQHATQCLPSVFSVLGLTTKVEAQQKYRERKDVALNTTSKCKKVIKNDFDLLSKIKRNEHEPKPIFLSVGQPQLSSSPFLTNQVL